MSDMDSTYTQSLLEVAVSLTKLEIEGMATAVTNKIKAVKEEKNTKHSLAQHMAI